jgi:predicted GNAT family N-acyltransferase
MEIREIQHRSPEYEEVVCLRDRILRLPLGLKLDQSELDAEASDIHLAAVDPESGRIAGCLVLTPLDRMRVRMRQVAVVEANRGAGIGKALIREAEVIGRKRGFSEIVLHARETVVPLYMKLGYKAIGEPFQEIGIAHRRMSKPLD